MYSNIERVTTKPIERCLVYGVSPKTTRFEIELSRFITKVDPTGVEKQYFLLHYFGF